MCIILEAAFMSLIYINGEYFNSFYVGSSIILSKCDLNKLFTAFNTPKSISRK